MDDKELLELAAKAAGYDVEPHPNRNKVYGLMFAYKGQNWNPLTDDGDALRLAVKCCISIEEALGWYYSGYDQEEYNKDPYAATRRAIVRAAAEMGGTL